MKLYLPYPLFWLIGGLLLGLGAWLGAPLVHRVEATVQAWLKPIIEGPPVPSSTTPQVVAGPMVRKGLLLRDQVSATTLPDGPPAESIGKRGFFDVYDVWPLQGKTDFFRIGNRHPIGWVKAADWLPWGTRLVVRLDPDAQPKPSAAPVLDWSQDRFEVAVWPADQPWADSYERKTLTASELPAERWGVLLNRQEVLEVLTAARSAPSRELRLRAAIGRLDSRPLGTPAELAAARGALPAVVFAGSTEPSAVEEALARLNEHWAPEASWGGLGFQFVPLSALP